MQFQDEPKILINIATIGTRSYGRSRGANANKVCTHYGRTGHTVDVCYRKHGFPPHVKFKNGSSTQNVFQDENADVKNNEEDIVCTRGEVPYDTQILFENFC